MKRSSVSKVFGIVSYFPDNDNSFHIETRRERTRRCSELLLRLESLWPDIDIMIIAQNWQDYTPPKIKNNIIIKSYPRLGILGARRELRKQFLDSNYDYLIMLDDDGRILNADPELYMNTIDSNPRGIGVIRHRSCPLMLLAISKYIYEQIDMPDVDPEKGEGFEDDIFVANCFRDFPELAYDFPKGCIEEYSLKYVGPGACPSTWAKEQKLNWNYMRKLTDIKIKDCQDVREYHSDDFEPVLDAVIPYVDGSDRNWSRIYCKTTGQYNVSTVRFRNWGMLKYVIRGIDKYIPCVRRIVLIVSSESQVPDWLDRNDDRVRIVYHENFIPKQFLPTFNSCTIESFLPNIEDLSEQFLYFNDDMLPISLMGLSDFFMEQTPCIQFIDREPIKSLFGKHCRSGLDLIASKLNKEKYPFNRLLVPEHTITPMLTSTLFHVSELCKYDILRTISMLRRKENLNQYIYSYYQYFTDNYIQGMCRYYYIDLDSDLRCIEYLLNQSNFQIICLNDSDKVSDYEARKKQLIALLDAKFPDRCKYEK